MGSGKGRALGTNKGICTKQTGAGLLLSLVFSLVII